MIYHNCWTEKDFGRRADGAADAPFGAKGLGEHPMYTSMAALSNAVYDAIHVPMLHLPVTPEKVLRAMGKIQ